MNFIEASIFLLFLAIISVPIAARLRLPLEVFLVIGSCVIGLLPWIPTFQLNPLIVFNLFLPPILFYAAYFTSWRDFKFNFRPICLLAFGLVTFTTLAVAVIAKLIVPTFTWAEGFLLGAIVSPTDASAATTLIKKLGAPKRLILILEGESLINDAMALLLFRFSLAAILVGSFSMVHAATQLIVVTAGGALIGFLIANAMVYILKKLNNAQAETTLTFVTAFICYLIADRLHVSGIISTVTGGIYFGIRFPEFATSHTRINAKASWNTVIFIINVFIFTLIGLELRWILQDLETYSMTTLLLYGAIISLVVIAVRIIWVFPAAHLSRILVPSIARKDPTPPWPMLFILSWSGMRGIVSLAAVLAIPNQLLSGAPFPHRNLMTFITYCVIVITLLLPSLTLPSLLQLFHMIDSEKDMKEEALARIRSLQNAITRITEIAKLENIPTNIFNEFLKQIERRLQIVQTQMSEIPYSTLTDDYFIFKKLTIAAIESEKESLIQLRKSAEIGDEVFHLLLEELDLEEIRAKSLRI